MRWGWTPALPAGGVRESPGQRVSGWTKTRRSQFRQSPPCLAHVRQADPAGAFLQPVLSSSSSIPRGLGSPSGLLGRASFNVHKSIMRAGLGPGYQTPWGRGSSFPRSFQALAQSQAASHSPFSPGALQSGPLLIPSLPHTLPCFLPGLRGEGRSGPGAGWETVPLTMVLAPGVRAWWTFIPSCSRRWGQLVGSLIPRPGQR